MAKQYTINVDGTDHQIESEPDMPLLYALTNDLELKGPKFGCGLAQCGACTVIHDGVAIRSCSTPVSAIKGKIRTLDGIGTPDKPHPVQKAFIESEAGQCQTDAEIRDALAGLKCRCGTHMAILRAVRSAADEMAGGDIS
jgi:nicotinate dehydrogenase subunit A